MDALVWFFCTGASPGDSDMVERWENDQNTARNQTHNSAATGIITVENYCKTYKDVQLSTICPSPSNWEAGHQPPCVSTRLLPHEPGAARTGCRTNRVLTLCG